MRTELKAKILQVCDEKIAKKGSNVGLSFYAFFANKNDDPECLMEATPLVDHFEKADKIKALVLAQSDN
jgi:hypothetical protein